MSEPVGYDAVAAECPHGYSAKVHYTGWEDGTVMVHVHNCVGKLCCVPGRRVARVARPGSGWVFLHGEIKSAAFEAAECGA